MFLPLWFCFFFFNDTATTEIYTLSLHDALPICRRGPQRPGGDRDAPHRSRARHVGGAYERRARSEEHTSELQSRPHLVCRLLLEKKKNIMTLRHHAEHSRVSVATTAAHNVAQVH